MWRDRLGAIADRVRAAAARFERAVLPPCLEAGAMPWYSLAYLVFPFIPLFISDFPRPDWTLTIVAALTFLPMYFAFYWVRGWRRIGLLFAMAALGIALLPANFFGNTFLVYSNVLAAYLPIPQMIGVVVLTQVLGTAAILSSEFQDMANVFITMNLVSCVLASICSRFWIATASKNQALRLSQEEIRRLAQVAERERISRDLHDLLGHTLSVIAIKSELAVKLFSRDANGARAEIADVERIAREALGQVRRAVTGMRAVGLRAEFASARLALAAASVDFEYSGPAASLHPETETVLALSLREAITNVIRHASAHRCHATVLRQGDDIVLIVRDDGMGGVLVDGNGLTGMRERAEALGGGLVVQSSATSGTVLTVRVRARGEPDATPDTAPDEAHGDALRLTAVR
jgi:two-component system, NarL family, sensor histidine kinase DesK